jgi:hypothetical protein
MAQLYDNVASGNIASWDVSSISQAYNHLRIVFSGRGDGAAVVTPVHMRLNNDSGANYDSQYLIGQKTLVVGAEQIGATYGWPGEYVDASATANLAANFDLLLVDYVSTTFYKTWVSKSYAPWGVLTNTVAVAGFGGTWRNTGAVNRVTILPNSGNFVAGSRLTIYGLL